jgi:DNA-directed RNA polymerase specialized sigma subunit
VTAPRIELERIARRYQKQQQALELTRTAMGFAILDARAQGMTLRAIAETTGLSFARVSQIEKSSVVRPAES